jgi:glycosyltransferase involved in cell wall biosynthesis
VKVGLNATCLNDRPSGAKQRFIGIYGELIKRLPECEFVIFEPEDCRVGAWFDGASNVTVRRTPLPSAGRFQRFFHGLSYWPGVLAQEKLDLFECFNQPLVKAPTGKTILTIHDIRRVHDGWASLEKVLYRASLARDLKLADHVITVSESMKQEINGLFPASQITFIYNGFAAQLFDAGTEKDLYDFRTKNDLPLEFLLAVGHLEPRKNYATLIEAMAILRNQGKPSNLLIIGNDSGERKKLELQINRAGLAGQVKFLSGLSDLEVRCAYKLSSLFIFPSVYEGFGIPILEAMAAGVPMVLSDIAVFKEITQKKGVYFPPESADLMAKAINRVLTIDSVSRQLIEHGKERVNAFQFTALASQVHGLYLKLLQN